MAAISSELICPSLGSRLMDRTAIAPDAVPSTLLSSLSSFPSHTPLIHRRWILPLGLGTLTSTISPNVATGWL